ncbi:putative proteasome subunit [Clavispora lusitaniae]|uniref:Proteasome subunit n=1 Tax=Clavispora lusitaniae TaxID=36911 RepID=A0ACD0WMW6_CLALS|nr:putative proteasome subunit [Clavispora lusitaniae]QFZ34303.1 putative proteasome subunit [Clavispora lusitaniae]QFZ39987.1 putative proteasome subunit [Clavispora lusitaniae]QFZ45669.1 putative proteasome subunit [Clavispora lusitaniae]QFZ51333.1 putative proteasome subunit [Clavispora lusitaniae]
MFRNNYDNDSVTYSPTGRLFQVEYALEAIKQGSATVGIASANHVVLVALKRNAEELGSYQKKIIKVDDHMGIALAGLAPDARVLSNYLRKLAMNSKLVFNRPLLTSKAALSIADKAQENTQSYGSRPYGVGLLVGGWDETGAHLYEFQPSGSVLEYYGAAIGARSQAARTYLERNLETIRQCTEIEDLVVHGLNALRDTLSQDMELTMKNTSVSVVGKDQDFVVYDDEDVQVWLDKLDSTSNARDVDEAGDAGNAGDDEAAEAENADATGIASGANEENTASDRMDTD